VDDWAFRKGHTYGTILVDLERHCIIDLLEDRLAETFATWLRAHPGIEIISRDRASAYAEGGRSGAPKAIQVADRWHLLRNIADALDPVLRRQVQLWKRAKAAAGTQEPRKQEPRKQEPKLLEPRLTPVKQQRREEMQGQYAQVQSLYEQGQSLHEIAKHLGIDTNALRYFVHNQPWATAQGRGGRRSGAASLDAYLPYIHKRWKAGCQNGMQLWREIHAQGYTGSASSVRPYLALLRQAPQALLPMKVSGRKSSISNAEENVFPVRRLIWLVLSRPERLTPEQTQEITCASVLHPRVALAFKLAQTFAQMLRERTVEALPAWLASARSSAIPEFVQLAHGMQRDLAAIEAAFCRLESNGQTEGKVNKLKTIKRQMYGRAKFDLLRQRMLLCG
jgi:transposase